MMSNRARRMAVHHQRHQADFELNLIPLIDILSVMVSFLLVYSTEVEVIQNSKGIEIPQSISQTAPNHSVVVMITKTDLFVQGELIESVKDVQADPARDHRAAERGPEAAAAGRQGDVRAALAAREITIMADKSLPYEVLKKVMATCTDADYGKISLAVLQKEKPVSLGRAPSGVGRHHAGTVLPKL